MRHEPGGTGFDGEAMERRSFLATLALCVPAVMTACSPGRSEAADSEAGGPSESTRSGSGTASTAGARVEPLDGWGVQLYTLRDRLDDDLEGTLAAIAGIGYAEVELVQLHGLTPTEMRSRLDTAGLRATSSHYPIQAFRDGLEESVDGAAELGQSLMVLPSIPSDERTAEGLARVAEDLSRAGERARAAGLRVGYHNHDWELRPMAGGTRPIDVLLDGSDPALVDWQMDIFWTVHGGADPLVMLEERGERVTSVHVKDRTADGRMVDVGDGVIDFPSVLAAAGSQALLHAFVEHDRPGDSIDSVRRSFGHLSSLGVSG